MELRYGLRFAVNLVNLSTPLGLLVAAAAGRARPGWGPNGLILAHGYRLPVPVASACTVGNVILLKVEDLDDHPGLLEHEARHATQYAYCLGPVMIVAYLLASGVSWLLCGDHASYNPFERLAGLADGGYEKHPLRARTRKPRSAST